MFKDDCERIPDSCDVRKDIMAAISAAGEGEE